MTVKHVKGLVLLCLLLGCSQSGDLEAVKARAGQETWVAVGKPQELQAAQPRQSPSAQPAPRPQLPQPPERAPAARAWRQAPSEDSALLLAQAYFPEFSSPSKPEEQQSPLPPEAALRVRLPATENGEMELATRGYLFRVKPQAGSEGARAQHSQGAAFYGARHFWMAVGGQQVAQQGLWLTPRVEEYVVTEPGGTPYRASFEVQVPEGIEVVRDAGEYLEFLDRQEAPVVRLHYAVARDGQGRSRQGTVRLAGARPAGRGGPGNLPRLALEGRSLKVEMEVGLQGLEGPVVVDPGWSSTGSMAQARYRPTSTLLPNGKVLVAAGDSAGGWGVQIASVELYDPETGTWSSAGTLAHAREFHTATLLPNGRVLISGGLTTGRRVIASVELYEPATGTWSPAGAMVTARCGHTATLLKTGKVLVAGGGNCEGGSIANSELYDPATGTWSATSPMNRGRVSHTATLLNNGKVLVAAGYSHTHTAELYDPATGTWSTTGSLAAYRDSHTATLLPNGKVLVAGGNIGTGISTSTASAELYDPATGSWSTTGSLTRSHAYHSAALLPNGKVLVGCGYSYDGNSGGAYLVNPELYDTATGTWSATFPMAMHRYDYAMTLLPDGSVLVAGGYPSPTASAERYSPDTGTWSTTGSPAAARSSHTTTLLPNGQVLVVGGQGASGPLSSAELYEPATGSWSTTGALSAGRARHTATLLPYGKVLVTGGEGTSGLLTSTELYDPAAGAWSSAEALATARSRHTATLLSDGRVLVVGGHGDSGPLPGAELYAPAVGSWLSTGALATARSGHTATLLPTGKVLVAGGESSAGLLSSAELYDPGAGTFSLTGALSTARSEHTATLLPTGKVLLIGGAGASGAVASAELYDPASGTFRATGALATARSRHVAVLLSTGKVLVASGLGPTGRLASAETYSLASGTFSAVGSLGASRADSTATLLPTGRVLTVGGGTATGALAQAELYEDTGALEAWRPVVTPPASLDVGQTVTVSGSGLRGISDASGGNTESSPTNFPLVSLMALEGGRRTPVLPQGFSDTALVFRVPAVVDGYYLLTATANAIPGGAVVFIDGPPPAPVLTAPAAGVNTPTPTIGGTAEAGSLITVFLDGAAVGTVTADTLGGWSFTPTSPLGLGPYTATATAADAAGNTSVLSAPRSFVVDNFTPPTVALTAPASGATLRGTVVFTATATDASGISRVDFFVGSTQVGSDTTAPYSLSYDTRSMPNGVRALTAQAYDVAGNMGTSAPVSVTFDNDFTPPTVTLTAPAAGTAVRGMVTLSATASDNVGVARVEFYVGATLVGTDTFSPYNFSWDTRTVGNGPILLTARAYDAAGQSATSAGVSVTVDNDLIPPSVSISAPWSGITVVGSVTVSATAEDNVGVTRVEFFEGGTLLASDSSWPYSFNWNTRAGPNGARTLSAKAYDAAGNTRTSSAVTVTADNDFSPPTVTITTPGDGETVSDTVVLAASATDTSGISQVVFLVNDNLVCVANTAPYSCSYNTRSLPNGLHGIRARAYDTLGNEGLSAGVAVTFDNDFTPPTVALTAPGQGATVKGTVTLTATATDARGISHVDFFVDGTHVGSDTAAPYSISYDTRSLPNGAHALTAQAQDIAGNRSTSAQVNVTFNNDFTPPTATLTAPAAGATVRGAVTLTATATDNIGVARVEFYVGATMVGTDTVSPYTFSWNTRTWANGAYLLTAKAYDAVEQPATSAAVSVTVDNDVTPPSVAISAPAAGATVKGTIAASATATDNLGVTRVEFLEEGTLLGSDTSSPYTYAWNTRTGANGARTLTARAYDAAGNTSTTEVTVTADNDFTPPTVTLTAPAEGATLTGTVVLTATATDNLAVTRVAFFVGTTQVGSDSSAPYSFSYNTRSLPNGARVLTAKAYDGLNNVGTSAPVNVTFDNEFTPPTVELTAPGEGETLTGTVVLTATASDPAGISKVVFFVGSTAVGTDTTEPYSFSYNTRSLPNGARVLTAKAYDGLNNVGTSAPVNVTFDNDLTVPTTSITSPASGTTLTGVVQIDAVASDDQGSITKVDFYQGSTLLGTATTAPYTWPWDTTKVATGNFTLKTRAWDVAGNSAYSTAVTVTVTR